MNENNEPIFYHVYENPEKEFLNQGDIFPPDLIICMLRDEDEEIKLEEEENYRVGWILLNPDCDVYKKDRINFLAVAPIYDLFYYYKNFSKNKNQLASLINQKKKEFYFLPPEAEISENGSFVAIGNLESFPIKMPVVMNKSGKIEAYEYLLLRRIKCLKHEWKAEFAHKIGYYFNRMGTPDLAENILDEWLDQIKTKFSE